MILWLLLHDNDKESDTNPEIRAVLKQILQGPNAWEGFTIMSEKLQIKIKPSMDIHELKVELETTLGGRCITKENGGAAAVLSQP